MHNAGFGALDKVAWHYGVDIDRKKRGALTGEVRGDINALLIKPQTYMNHSGECVLDFAAYYKAQPEDIIVIYDDIDLPLGDIRVRAGGGAGTHNGMRDIVKQIGSCEFPRVRIGIGPKPEQWDIVDYVLSRPQNDEDKKKLEAAYKRAASAVVSILTEGVELAQRKYNVKKG